MAGVWPSLNPSSFVFFSVFSYLMTPKEEQSSSGSPPCSVGVAV